MVLAGSLGGGGGFVRFKHPQGAILLTSIWGLGEAMGLVGCIWCEVLAAIGLVLDFSPKTGN